ncbi:protein smoothened-like [Ornithodoros turicata]|uniref:protein smoothened-like n=1 Tax=Ornithodoros turicata TaxID=34597 RepID=UPI003138C230
MLTMSSHQLPSSVRTCTTINTLKLVVVKLYIVVVVLGTVCGEVPLFSSQSRPTRHGNETLGSSPTNTTSDVDYQIDNLVHDSAQSPADVTKARILKSFEKSSKLQGDFRHSSPLHRNWPQSDSCYRRAKCEPLLDNTCFGVELPYAETSIQLVNDSTSQLEIQERLNLWQGLEQIPRCWAVVQPLLCAYYRPRCQDDQVALPSQEMCRLARGFCKIAAVGSEWPPFLRCEADFFPSGCKNELREIKFNTTGQCGTPLVATPSQSSWYQEVEGCGVRCQHPLLNEEELSSMRTFVVFVTTLAVIASLFAVLTFLIGWKEASQYPNVMVFYINLCLLFVCIGWLSQFVPGAREAITCRRDGTLRNGEPSSGEHLSCMVVFFLVYYFLMAALCWFVMLAYAWDHRFQSRGGPQREALGAKSAYFHLVAWSVPFVLTISVLALGVVDGDSVMGICFVSSRNPVVRSVFVLCPVTAAYLAGSYFLCRELYKLITLKSSNGGVLNNRVRAKIQRMILRIGLFVLLMTVLVSCTFVCHVYEFRNIPVWQATLRDYIACRAKVLAAQAAIPDSSPHCNIGTKPSLAMLQLHLMAFLGTCVGLSSWIVTSATGSTWKRFWQRSILRQSSEEPTKLQRHKLIAEAFARRNELNRGQGGLHSTHDDPVGMNLDLNSVTSQDLSSTWAAALPGFLHRRGAVAGPNVLPVRRYSSTSDVSRQMSMSIRRQSLDSQLSYQLTAEQRWLAAQRAIARNQRRKTRRERERLLQRQSPFPLPFRRGSDSSIQSTALRRSARHAPAAVAKATSTGDLNPGSVLSQKPPFRPRVLAAQQKNGTLINPPFTHGMSDQSRPREASVSAANTTAQGTEASSSAAAAEASAKTFPTLMPPFSAVPNPYAPYMGVPYGYPPFYPGFPYFPPGMYPYGQAFASYPDLHPQHTPLIPLHPMPDSMSETSFIPIITSDSEYTDVGIRSFDEAQLEAARRIVEERTRMVGQPGSRPQTNQETQTEQTVTESPLPRAELNPTRLSVKSPTEAIEMREIGSGQSRRSNLSNASRARKSPMSRASVMNPPPSSVFPPTAHAQNRAELQPRSPSQCTAQNLSVHLEPYCNPQVTNDGNHWQQQQQCCSGCPCGQDPPARSGLENPYGNGYLQGQQVVGPYYGEHHVSSSGPADSCPSHSDGVQSCHTYMFAPVASPTHVHCSQNDAPQNGGFFGPAEQHHTFGYNGCAIATSPCEGSSAGHAGTCHNGGPQDATGFVSR